MKVLNILEDEDADISISTISFWEIAIKYQCKKIRLGKINPLHLPHIAEQYNFNLLNPEPFKFISEKHSIINISQKKVLDIPEIQICGCAVAL